MHVARSVPILNTMRKHARVPKYVSKTTFRALLRYLHKPIPTFIYPYTRLPFVRTLHDHFLKNVRENIDPQQKKSRAQKCRNCVHRIGQNSVREIGNTPLQFLKVCTRLFLLRICVSPCIFKKIDDLCTGQMACAVPIWGDRVRWLFKTRFLDGFSHLVVPKMDLFRGR